MKKASRVEMRGRRPTNELVHVDLAFHCGTARKVDVDNLAKLALDAINGVVFVDDAQIVDLHARKRIDRKSPRTVIRVFALPAVQQTINAA